jgi:PTH1 family peptidyl-tRNA hydrolase
LNYLIAGLGNIGEKYAQTRHNIGFMVLDKVSSLSNFSFSDKRYGFIAEHLLKGRKIYFLKPSTFMNLSGIAINYWLKKLDVQLDNLLVICDDIALPFGKIRLRSKGSDGGHNGLINIIEVLGTQNFARLRFGIGNNFEKGQQVNYVLSNFNENELNELPEKLLICRDIIYSFVFQGINSTMNNFNKN